MGAMRKWICVLLVMSNCVVMAQVKPTRIRVSEAVSAALIVKKVPAEYPPNTDLKGIVVLAVKIGTDGSVVEVKPLSGYEKLIPNAVSAAKQYKYKPYYLGGEPLQVETTITIPFEPPKKK